jgi:hypothetical protein
LAISAVLRQIEPFKIWNDLRNGILVALQIIINMVYKAF